MVKWWGVTLLSCNNRNNCGVFISLFLSPGSLPLHEKSLMIFDGLQWPTWTPWKSPRLSSCINLRSSITCRELLWNQDLEKNWTYCFLFVCICICLVYEVLNLIPHHTEDLEWIENTCETNTSFINKLALREVGMKEKVIVSVGNWNLIWHFRPEPFIQISNMYIRRIC